MGPVLPALAPLFVGLAVVFDIGAVTLRKTLTGSIVYLGLFVFRSAAVDIIFSQLDRSFGHFPYVFQDNVVVGVLLVVFE